MVIKSNVFFLDLKTLKQKGDDNLKEFAKNEELEVEDIINIICNEAARIGESNKVKVTFKIIDGNDDSFRVIVEPAIAKYKGTVIYPFEKIKSEDFEMYLDEICGKITLFNRKDDVKKISVTIDGIAFDLFTMTYEKAIEYLMDVSDRKEKDGYIKFEDSVCFKTYGVKVCAKIGKSGNPLTKEHIDCIEVYNKDEFDRIFKLKSKEEIKEEKKQEKYDVDIEKVAREISSREYKAPEIEISNLDETIKEEKKKKVEKDTANLDKKLTEKLSNIKKEQKYDVDYDELVKQSSSLEYTIPEFSMDELNKKDEEDRKRRDEEYRKHQEELDKVLNEKLYGKKEEVVEEKVEEVKIEEPEIEIIEPEIIEEPEIEVIEPEIPEVEEDNEIEELTKLFKENMKQQKELEERITKKLEELKNLSKKEEKVEVKKEKVKVEQSVKKETKPVQRIKFTEPEDLNAFEVVSYKGIRKPGARQLEVFFGEDKSAVRKYFGGNVKEVRDFEEMEVYDIFYAYYNELDECTGIGIYNQEVYKDKVKLFFNEENLITMKYKDIVSLIKSADENAIEDEDGIISLKYGISVDPKETKNYQDSICDVIHLFQKGYYDDVYNV